MRKAGSRMCSRRCLSSSWAPMPTPLLRCCEAFRIIALLLLPCGLCRKRVHTRDDATPCEHMLLRLYPTSTPLAHLQIDCRNGENQPASMKPWSTGKIKTIARLSRKSCQSKVFEILDRTWAGFFRRAHVAPDHRLTARLADDSRLLLPVPEAAVAAEALPPAVLVAAALCTDSLFSAASSSGTSSASPPYTAGNTCGGMLLCRASSLSLPDRNTILFRVSSVRMNGRTYITPTHTERLAHQVPLDKILVQQQQNCS